MFNKFTLFLSFIIMFFVHMTVFTMYKSEKKEQVVSQKSTVRTISVKKVVLKKKQVKKVEKKKEIKKIVKTKPREKRPKKIVKKAKRKITKKIVKKEIKKIQKLKKEVEKVVKKEILKSIPKITKEELPRISKKMIVSTATKNMIKNEYLSKLRTKIERNKAYPKRAKRLKQQGKVIVSFEILENGKIERVSLKNGCSYSRLNNAAIKLLKEIAKFDPIPKELEKNRWAIEIPINYSIVNI